MEYGTKLIGYHFKIIKGVEKYTIGELPFACALFFGNVWGYWLSSWFSFLHPV